MALERTLSIVKPDGVEKNLIGEVYRRFEQAGLTMERVRSRAMGSSGKFAGDNGKPADAHALGEGPRPAASNTLV